MNAVTRPGGGKITVPDILFRKRRVPENSSEKRSENHLPDGL